MTMSNPKKLVYFAHSMLDYNTKREAEVRSLLESYLDKDIQLVCPNRDLKKLGRDMNLFLEFVKRCSLVIVMENLFGFVGHGVYSEVEVALSFNISVYVWRKNLLFNVYGIAVKDENDWRAKYGQLVVGDLVNAKDAQTIKS